MWFDSGVEATKQIRERRFTESW